MSSARNLESLESRSTIIIIIDFKWMVIGDVITNYFEIEPMYCYNSVFDNNICSFRDRSYRVA